MGLIIFFAIAVPAALLWHALLPRYMPASIGATVTTVVVFQVAAFINLGYLNPFFLVAAVTTSVVALLVSLLAGWPFEARRKRRRGEATAL